MFLLLLLFCTVAAGGPLAKCCAGVEETAQEARDAAVMVQQLCEEVMQRIENVVALT